MLGVPNTIHNLYKPAVAVSPSRSSPMHGIARYLVMAGLLCA